MRQIYLKNSTTQLKETTIYNLKTAMLVSWVHINE